MIKKPYGEEDPFASIELIASTKVIEKYEADQIPVLAARVSHAGSGKTGEEVEKDNKLMSFLAEHRHMTPFEHQSATFKIVAPIFVVREWHRHRTQAYNEISMRYSSDAVGKLYYPQEWRMQANRDKQSSAGNLDEETTKMADRLLQRTYIQSIGTYKQLLKVGVCREQARTVIPVGNYTEMYATASLRNWFAFWLLRSDEHAQWEIRKYSDCIADILRELWPNSWAALENNK